MFICCLMMILIVILVQYPISNFGRYQISNIQASATFSVEYGLQADLMVVLEIEDETRVETFEVIFEGGRYFGQFLPLALNALQWLLGHWIK